MDISLMDEGMTGRVEADPRLVLRKRSFLHCAMDFIDHLLQAVGLGEKGRTRWDAISVAPS